MDVIKFCQQIITMLDIAGLLIQEPYPLDKRRMLIYPSDL